MPHNNPKVNLYSKMMVRYIGNLAADSHCVYFAGRSRWVYYSDEKFGWHYDASQIPPDW